MKKKAEEGKQKERKKNEKDRKRNNEFLKIFYKKI